MCYPQLRTKGVDIRLQAVFNYIESFLENLIMRESTEQHTELDASLGRTAQVPLTVSRPDLLKGGDDGDFRRLVHSLLAFSAKLQRIRDAFGAYLDLTGIQYTLLVSVAHMEGGEGVGVKQVADHLSLSGTFVTTQTKKLERAGLLARHINPLDRRRVILAVTDSGNSLLTELAPVQQKTNDALFQHLSEAEFDRLLTLTDGLLEGAMEATSLVAHLSMTTPRRRLA